MIEESELTQKREELKRQLATGKYRSLMHVILDRTGHLIQKLTRSSELPSFWYSAAIIALVTLLISFLTSILLGEFYPLRRERIPAEISLVVLALTGMVFSRIYEGIILTTFHDDILDAFNSVTDLADLQRWAARLSNYWRPTFFGLIFSIFLGFYTPLFFAAIFGGFIGWGPTILALIVSFQAGVIIYHFIPLVSLPARLSQYQFKLYTADPSRSEVVDCLSDMFSNFVYISAVLAAIATLSFNFLAMLNLWNFVILVLTAWGPLIAIFITNHYALGKIITKAKWRTLNEIQAQVEELQGGKLAEKENMEVVNRLMDYHDRIGDTRNTALNLRTGLNFINSLLLPLLAFLLTNLDKVLGFF